MEVILRENITALGKIGDIIKVKTGHARNYLIPNRLAYQATGANRKRLEAERKSLEAKEAEQMDGSQKLAQQIEAVTVTIKKEVGEENRLYGSVTASDIANALQEQGVTADRRTISLGHPIKVLGEYEVDVHVHADVVAKCKLHVVKA